MRTISHDPFLSTVPADVNGDLSPAHLGIREESPEHFPRLAQPSCLPGEPGPGCPPPGVYTNVPWSVYHAWDCASSHRLSDIVQHSPAHCRWNIEHDKDTDSLRLGRAIHCAILQPDLFPSNYLVTSTCAATKANGDPCRNEGGKWRNGNWYCGVHEKGPGDALPVNVELLTLAEMEKVTTVAAAVLQHEMARPLLDLSHADHRELSIVWRDEQTGELCKMRADFLSVSARFVGDIKSTTDAQAATFLRQSARLGYERNAAFYLDGARAAGLKMNTFRVVAVETEGFPGVSIHEFDDEILEMGRAQNADALAQWSQCRSRGVWPSYPSRVEVITAPAWKRQLADLAGRELAIAGAAI